MILEIGSIAPALTQRERRHGRTVVMTNGCFDILHAGHIYSLREAKALGDVLVVAVNSDSSVRKLKGDTRPVVRLADRMAVLDALEMVDYVVSFGDETPERLICEVLPDVLAKGGDYKVHEIAGHRCVQANGGRVVIMPLLDGKSTTKMIEKVVELNK